MTYTTTEEREFKAQGKATVLTSAVTIAENGVLNLAQEAEFQEMVIRSFGMSVRAVQEDSLVIYHVTAWGTFARIVPATELHEGDMDAEREAREPEGKDYSDLEPF